MAKRQADRSIPVLVVRNEYGDQGFLLHLDFAALAAIWERFFGVSEAARAAPPFSPPSRPKATAAGFLGLIAGGSVLGASPMDSRKTRCASWLGSRGRVFERSGMMPSVWQAGPCRQEQENSNRPTTGTLNIISVIGSYADPPTTPFLRPSWRLPLRRYFPAPKRQPPAWSLAPGEIITPRNHQSSCPAPTKMDPPVSTASKA